MALILSNSQILSAPTFPTPGDRVLIIHNDNGYNISERDAIVAALAGVPSPPTIDFLQVGAASNNGFSDELAAAGYALEDYCQVWDIRFNDAHQGVAYSGTIEEESITAGDTAAFQAFLGSGGHLYLQGDHSEYFSRNESLMQFIATATGTPISYPSVCPCQVTWTNFDNNPPDFFQSNLNNLTQIASWYPGYIPMTGIGTGTPLTTNPTYGALDLLWQAGSLTAGNGQLAVGFDTNMIVNDTNITATNQSLEYLQNLYVTLSTCFNFEVEKTVNNPGPVCVGEQITWSICVENTGSRAIPNQQLWDSLPGCFSYVSSSMTLSGDSNAGQNFYVWDVPNLAVGATQCVDITVDIDVGGPCP